jgi:hypothetical protein
MSKTSTPIELCWVAAKRVARVRRQPAWRALIDEAAKEAPEELGDPALWEQEVPLEDRRDVLTILARADAVDGDGVAGAVAAGLRADGKFAPPLVLTAGELRLPFDELETLKATVTTATPFVPGDDVLKAAVDGAKDFLAIPDLSPAPAVLDAMTGRVREAFGRVKRAVPASYLEAQTERALLEQRRYQKRVFRGEPHLRALLQGPSDKAATLVYLPDAVAEQLPLFARFGARIIAEAHLAVDQFEPHPHALEALVVAREIAAPAPRRA